MRSSFPLADDLLLRHLYLFTSERLKGPVLDLACGDGHNGLFLASKGASVVLADISREALEEAEAWAGSLGLAASPWHVDLEVRGANPLHDRTFGAILVFRYLHRPLIPCLRKALAEGGILLYETFTKDQCRFGRPRNPDHLLSPGELRAFFEDWDIIHYFEGEAEDPARAIARIVCRKT